MLLLLKEKWIKYILALQQKLQSLIMKRKGHLLFVRMDFLMQWCGILGTRRQRQWPTLEMMNISTCCVWKLLLWKKQSL
nr:hypothetical protein C4D60_Mb09t12500 [Ipomoea batatas]